MAAKLGSPVAGASLRRGRRRRLHVQRGCNRSGRKMSERKGAAMVLTEVAVGEARLDGQRVGLSDRVGPHQIELAVAAHNDQGQ